VTQEESKTEAEEVLPSGAAEGGEPADELSLAKQEAQRLKDQLLRTAADFDNFRKRARREQADAERKGRDDLLKEMLPVFDNLERAASHARGAAEGDSKGLLDGLDLVLRQFEDTLGRLGVERVPGVGAPFDPSVHEAIQQLETSEYPQGSIAALVQAGYRQAERLIRPALVVVAKAPAEAPSGGEAPPAAN
jgi:molecular chaperone GrpE